MKESPDSFWRQFLWWGLVLSLIVGSNAVAQISLVSSFLSSGNGVLDSFMVVNDVSGTDIRVTNFEAHTAKYLLGEVDSLAQMKAADTKLVWISGSKLNYNGTAISWHYIYASFGQSKEYLFYTLGSDIIFEGVGELRDGTAIIDTDWIDSDSALTIAEAAGGSNFRSIYPDWEIKAVLNMALFPPFLTYWRITYSSDSTGEKFYVLFDAVTGELVTGVEPERQSADVPYSPKLSQNYPNPFNPVTTIEYRITRKDHVRLCVLDILGREVNVIVDEIKTHGVYQVIWDGKDSKGKSVSSGIYLYELWAGSFRQMRRMLLIR